MNSGHDGIAKAGIFSEIDLKILYKIFDVILCKSDAAIIFTQKYDNSIIFFQKITVNIHILAFIAAIPVFMCSTAQADI